MKRTSRPRRIRSHRELRSPCSPPNVSAVSARPAAISETDDWTRKIATYFSDSFEYWDRVYSSHIVKAQVYSNRMAVILRWATMVTGPGAAAADVGTGAGHFAVALAKSGIRVVAIDASEAMLARVAQNASRAGVADLVVPITSDAQRLELASATCDVVVAIGLLPWVKQPELALREMVRITKPGGHVIVTMDNALSLARGLDPGWHASARGFIHRIRRLVAGHSVEPSPVHWPAATTLSDFDRLLRDVGLDPLEFEGVGFGPFTVLGRNVLPNRVGLRVDRLLQRLADHNVPPLKHAAVFHVALAVKPTEEDATAPAAALQPSKPARHPGKQRIQPCEPTTAEHYPARSQTIYHAKWL
jgi:2-polyprenyl-3-methyl-5-hydroxy-6-metoxy-1,4-benzoquinol methylase